MVASGGHPSSRANSASTRSFHYELWVRWNRSLCRVVLRVSHRHLHILPVVGAGAPFSLAQQVPPLAEQPRDGRWFDSRCCVVSHWHLASPTAADGQSGRTPSGKD
jgi:hypothetical protein